MEKLEVLVRYYSYLEDGARTISIMHSDRDCFKNAPYYISANGGVAMMWMNETEVAEVARICIKKKIKIDSINAH